MCIDDGRVVSNFVAQVATSCSLLFEHLNAYALCIFGNKMLIMNYVFQALRKEPLTVYGDGKQTRSFQYVSDLVGPSITLKGAFEQTCQYQMP
jgi:dTDP-D-glucose 4,6-dehydratase